MKNYSCRKDLRIPLFPSGGGKNKSAGKTCWCRHSWYKGGLLLGVKEIKCSIRR